MTHKTFSASLPIELTDYATAYSAKLSEDRCYALDLVVADEHSKTKLNQLLQARGYNKRQANSLLIDVGGKADSANKCRENHISQLEGKIKSASEQIEAWEAQLAKLTYPCCDRKRNQFKTTQHRLRFKIHHKRRYLIHQQRKLDALQDKPISVNLGPINNFSLTGSQGESKGNQIAQYDGRRIKIRVPVEMESIFGKYVTASLQFKYGQDAIAAALMRRAVKRTNGAIIPAGQGEALTWRIYQKNGRWYIAVTVDVTAVPRQSKSRRYGCIGVDINPGVIGW